MQGVRLTCRHLERRTFRRVKWRVHADMRGTGFVDDYHWDSPILKVVSHLDRGPINPSAVSPIGGYPRVETPLAVMNKAIQ